MSLVRVLRTVKYNLTSHNNFPYPLWTEETGPVKVSCEDWDPNPECGNGLHGITKENYQYPVYDQYSTRHIKWMVIEVDDNPDNFVKIDDKKVKFREGFIIYQGNDSDKAIKMVFDDEKSLSKLMFYDDTYYGYTKLTYDLAKIVCNQTPYMINHILECNSHLVDYDLCELTVTQDGLTIAYILSDKPELVDYNLCELAIKQNGDTIYHILKHKPELVDYELCNLAVSLNRHAIKQILKYKPELVTYELRELHKKLWE